MALSMEVEPMEKTYIYLFYFRLIQQRPVAPCTEGEPTKKTCRFSSKLDPLGKRNRDVITEVLKLIYFYSIVWASGQDYTLRVSVENIDNYFHKNLFTYIFFKTSLIIITK